MINFLEIKLGARSREVQRNRHMKVDEIGEKGSLKSKLVMIPEERRRGSLQRP